MIDGREVCETCDRSLPVGRHGRCAPCKRLETMERRRRISDGTATEADLAINGYTTQRRPQRSRVMMTCRNCGGAFARIANSRGAKKGDQYRCQSCYLLDRWGSATRLDPGTRAVLTVRINKVLLEAIKQEAIDAGMALSPFIEQLLANHAEGSNK